MASSGLLPQVDPASPAMIGVAPQLPLRIDASIPPAFRVRVGDHAERNRAVVTVLNIGNPNQVPEAFLRDWIGPDGQVIKDKEGKPKQVGDMKIPMPAAMDGFVQDKYDGHARVVVHSALGVPFKSWEFEWPQLQPDGSWTCENVTEHILHDDYSHCFLTSSGSGSGLSFEKYLLTAADLNSEIPHPLLITLPPHLFGLYDPDPTRPVNFAYCAGLATMPLSAKRSEGGQTGDAAWGTGVSVFLRPSALTSDKTKALSAQALRILRCLIVQGAQVNDRDAGTRKPEVVAISGETSLPLSVCQEINQAGLTLNDFVVGRISARYNWKTKLNQYPVL